MPLGSRKDVMKAYLNSINGIDDALVSLLFSKRSWSREKEIETKLLVSNVTSRYGFPYVDIEDSDEECKEFNKKIDMLAKWGVRHITLLKFIDLSVTVEGLHRGGQDDFDSHAKRFDNRIIRNSTRLAKFGNEKSDFYVGKILTLDDLVELGVIHAPQYFCIDGKKYVKAANGYVLEEYKDNKDVLRGLYPLSIPSSFTFKINLAEWAHVYKERNKDGTANPEVKELVENIQSQIEYAYPQFNREFMLKVKN